MMSWMVLTLSEELGKVESPSRRETVEEKKMARLLNGVGVRRTDGQAGRDRWMGHQLIHPNQGKQRERLAVIGMAGH